MGIRCFLLTPTDQYVVSLRRFTFSASDDHGHLCPAKPKWGCDSPMTRIDLVRWDGRSGLGREPRGERAWGWGGDPVKNEVPAYKGVTSHHDHRWPKVCEQCGQPFPVHAEYQLNLDILFQRSDGGPMTTLRDAPVGAMWLADWMPDCWRGPDGKTLQVRLPGNHDWTVDAQASNCTKKNDQVHRCWVRHGTPPLVTVDKNGNTCDAGGGSIQIPGWHGFLRNGELVES